MTRDPKRAAADPWRDGLSAARAAQAESLSALHSWWKAAERRLEPAVLARRAADALETMGEGDGISWGMIACELLRRHGGAVEAERLRAFKGRLPARRALRDWRLEAARALAVIDARASGVCTCTAEARHGGPVVDPQLSVLSEEVDVAQYAVIMQVSCTCGRRWQVHRQEGYHYPVFRWSAVDGG